MSTSSTATPATPQAPAEFLLQMATGYMVSSALTRIVPNKSPLSAVEARVKA